MFLFFYVKKCPESKSKTNKKTKVAGILNYYTCCRERTAYILCCQPITLNIADDTDSINKQARCWRACLLLFFLLDNRF